MKKRITILAGKTALEIIKSGGIKADQIATVAGAAGGPKWLVLNGFDRALFGTFFKHRTRPLSLIGSSIGIWRFCSALQRNTNEAIDTFEDAYIGQKYHGIPTIHEVTEESWKILHRCVPVKTVKELLSHPYARINIITARGRSILSSDKKTVLAPSLALSFALNMISRTSLSLFFERVIFHDTRSLSPLKNNGNISTRYVPLKTDNFIEAVMATGSIPLVMEGIRNINGAPRGYYRDGGMIDYHMALPVSCSGDDLVLFPHYREKIFPGWFDKNIPFKEASEKYTGRMILIAPSASFVRSFPGSKVPDRDDFKTFMGKDTSRFAQWHGIAKKCRPLGEDLLEAFASGKIREMVKPIGDGEY